MKVASWTSWKTQQLALSQRPSCGVLATRGDPGNADGRTGLPVRVGDDGSGLMRPLPRAAQTMKGGSPWDALARSSNQFWRTVRYAT